MWQSSSKEYPSVLKEKKIVKKYKKLQPFMSVFHSITVIALDEFLNSALVIIPQKKAPTSYFYSSQHVQNGREKTMSYVYTVSWIHTVKVKFVLVKKCNSVTLSALMIFLMVLWNESKHGPASNAWNTVVLLFWFGSHEQLPNNSHRNWWLSVCVILFSYMKNRYHNA